VKREAWELKQVGDEKERGERRERTVVEIVLTRSIEPCRRELPGMKYRQTLFVG